MCRRVEDLALITPIISGPDFRDAACAPVPWSDPGAVDVRQLNVAFCVDNGATARAATDEDTKKTVRQAATWLEEAATSVHEDAPQAALNDIAEAASKR